MGRWLVGMSGDKDAMIAHHEKCEKRMLEQFAEIKEIAVSVLNEKQDSRVVVKWLREIISLCDVYLDKRSDKQKMQDQIDVLQDKLEKMESDSECECC